MSEMIVNCVSYADGKRMGSVELLAPRLADYQQERAIDRGGMVGAWVAAGLNNGASVSQRQIIPLARRMGARPETREREAPADWRTGRDLEPRPMPGTRPSFPVYGALLLVWALFLVFVLPVLESYRIRTGEKES